MMATFKVLAEQNGVLFHDLVSPEGYFVVFIKLSVVVSNLSQFLNKVDVHYQRGT